MIYFDMIFCIVRISFVMSWKDYDKVIDLPRNFNCWSCVGDNAYLMFVDELFLI